MGCIIYDARNTKRIRNKLLKYINEDGLPLDARVYGFVGAKLGIQKMQKICLRQPILIYTSHRRWDSYLGVGGCKNRYLWAIMGLLNL